MNHGRSALPDDPIDCEAALRQLAAYLDAELEAPNAATLEAHLNACASCFSRAGFERRLKEEIREQLDRGHVPPGLERRIRALVSQLPGAS